MASAPMRKERCEDTKETQGRKPGNTKNSQQPLKVRRTMEGFFSRDFSGDMALLTP